VAERSQAERHLCLTLCRRSGVQEGRACRGARRVGGRPPQPAQGPNTAASFQPMTGPMTGPAWSSGPRPSTTTRRTAPHHANGFVPFRLGARVIFYPGPPSRSPFSPVDAALARLPVGRGWRRVSRAPQRGANCVWSRARPPGCRN